MVFSFIIKLKNVMTLEYDTLVKDMRASDNEDDLRAADFVPRLQRYGLPIATAWRIALGLLDPAKECKELEQFWTTYAYRELTIRKGYRVWNIIPTSRVGWVSCRDFCASEPRVRRYWARIVAYFVVWHPSTPAHDMRVFKSFIPFGFADTLPLRGLSCDSSIDPSEYLMECE